MDYLKLLWRGMKPTFANYAAFQLLGTYIIYNFHPNWLTPDKLTYYTLFSIVFSTVRKQFEFIVIQVKSIKILFYVFAALLVIALFPILHLEGASSVYKLVMLILVLLFSISFGVWYEIEYQRVQKMIAVYEKGNFK